GKRRCGAGVTTGGSTEVRCVLGQTPIEPQTSQKEEPVPECLDAIRVSLSSKPTNGSAMSFFFSSRRRHTRLVSDWSSDVCSSDLPLPGRSVRIVLVEPGHGPPGAHRDPARARPGRAKPRLHAQG